MIKVTVLLYEYILPHGIREQQVNVELECQIIIRAQNYNQNATNLKDGVIVHGNSQYEKGMQLTEMGCTKVIISGNGEPKDDPKNRVAHYKRGTET